MDTKVIQRVGDLLGKNSPTILTGLGVAGLVSTVVIAVKATPKAMAILNDELDVRVKEQQDKYHKQDVAIDPLTKKDIIKLTWKCYIPAMILGGVTIGCIIGANSINLRRNAALASLYSLSEATLKEYQTKVVETIGKNKEREIKDEIAKDKITKNPVLDNEVIFTGKGDTLCYDSLSGRYFKSDIEYIRSVFNTLNYDLRNEMFVTLNQFYSELGLEATALGDLMGWHIDQGIVEPDFSSHLTHDNRPCLSINYSVEPRYSQIE
jgi:hypothetical protein